MCGIHYTLSSTFDMLNNFHNKFKIGGGEKDHTLKGWKQLKNRPYENNLNWVPEKTKLGGVELFLGCSKGF